MMVVVMSAHGAHQDAALAERSRLPDRKNLRPVITMLFRVHRDAERAEMPCASALSLSDLLCHAQGRDSGTEAADDETPAFSTSAVAPAGVTGPPLSVSPRWGRTPSAVARVIAAASHRIRERKVMTKSPIPPQSGISDKCESGGATQYRPTEEAWLLAGSCQWTAHPPTEENPTFCKYPCASNTQAPPQTMAEDLAVGLSPSARSCRAVALRPILSGSRPQV